MRVALIHAVRVAMDPVAEAFSRLWPEAGLVHVLDDSLSADRVRDDGLTPAMTERFLTLTRYAVDTGADGVLFTCSAFGPCIEAAAASVDVPVLKPNEAMFETARGSGTRIGLLASFAPSLPPMVAEFNELVGSNGQLTTACAAEAMTALEAGDTASHDRLLAEAARDLAGCDTIMLAQFSTARAKDTVAGATGLPVLTSPDSAVAALKVRLTGESNSWQLR